jgi:hypothetical protein
MHHSKSMSIQLFLLSTSLCRWRQGGGNLGWPHDFLWWIDWHRCLQSIPSKKSGRARVPRKNLAPQALRLKSNRISALLADEGLGLDRCFFVLGRLALMHRIVSQRGNRARKPPPSPRASHVSTSAPTPTQVSPRGRFEGWPSGFLATPLGKHAYKRGRGAEHAAEACPARARSRCVTPSRHWSPTPPLHSSGRRAGWPHDLPAPTGPYLESAREKTRK